MNNPSVILFQLVDFQLKLFSVLTKWDQQIGSKVKNRKKKIKKE